MSGLLPDDNPVQLQDGWLPTDTRIQLIHGQHRKAVLECVIASQGNLLQESLGGLLPTQPTLEPNAPPVPLDRATLGQVHSSPDAWWSIKLYGKCKSYCHTG